MSDEGDLRKYAQQAIESGKLSNRTPSRIWGGNGFGMHCAICGILVDSDELGYELQFTENDDPATTTEYCVHVRCFAAWNEERRHPVSSPPGPDPLSADQREGTISPRERRPSRREPG
jgi:hypothetical protein